MRARLSGLRLARASSLGLAMALAMLGGAGAQDAASVLVVDLERALRDSAAASALRAMEVGERRALRDKLDAMKSALEDEEARMVVLRDTLPKEEFDVLVRDFDQRVRTARRVAQQDAAALQARFATAQATLERAARPLIEALMREHGAVLVIDRKTALAVAPDFDATDALIARLDAAQPSAAALAPEAQR